MVFGQMVVRPSGSGKTTYCNGISQFLSLIGRKVAIINLDPANDLLPYECAVSIEDLIKPSDVMMEHSLGPNGVDCVEESADVAESVESETYNIAKDAEVYIEATGSLMKSGPRHQSLCLLPRAELVDNLATSTAPEMQSVHTSDSEFGMTPVLNSFNDEFE